MALLLLVAAPVGATDPERGARLFASPPAPGLLACADCHSEDPLVTNFGNIFVGRNAASLIQRAVVANTGGMGVFREFYDDAALADIAAYLGNSPRALDFGTQPLGSSGATQEVVVRASSKLPIERLALAIEGDFAIVGSDCAGSLATRAACSVQLAFRPLAAGARGGVLRIEHSGLPTPARVVLTGQGLDRPPAQARVTPGSLSFTALGASRQVLLVNDSANLLTLGRISVSSPAFEVNGGTCVAGAVLAGGQSCALALRWASADAAGAVLTLLHDGVGGRSDVALAGTVGAAPVSLVAAPAVLDFGALEINAKSALLSTWLHNPGPAPLRLGAISSTRAEVAVAAGGCASGGTLAVGASCPVQLRWSPTRPGAMAGELRVAVEGGTAPLRVLRVLLAGRATGPSAWLSLAPSVLPLQAAPGQRSATATAMLVNRGGAPARLGVLALEGEAAADFELDAGSSCQSGRVLAPQESCQLRLALRPAAAGDRRSRLRVSHDAPGAPLLLGLVGSVSTALPLWVDRSRIDFGLGDGGGTGTVTTQRLTLFNRSDVEMPLTRIDLVGDAATDFSLAGSCRAGSILAAGASCIVDLGFVPTRAGPRSATLLLTVVGTSPGAVAVVAGVNAAGVGAGPAGALQWRRDPSAPGDAGVSVGESSVATWQLHNTSGAALTLSGLDFAGPAWAEFALERPDVACRAGLSLAAGASCSASLRFQPAGAGTRQASLSARAEGQDPATLQLTGTGIAPARGIGLLQPAELVFDAADPGQRQRVRVENGGAGLLTVQPGVLQGSGFDTVGAGDEACAAEAFVLLPGDSCLLEFSWPGGAAARLGGRWTALADGQLLSTTLAVNEDPAARSNIGAGALGWGSGDVWLDLLAVLVLLGGLARVLRADRTESRDA